MACYHPLKAFIVGTNPDTGKSILKIKPFDTQYVYHIKEDYDEDRYFRSTESLCANALNCDDKLCDPMRCDDFEIIADHHIFRTADNVSWKFHIIPCGQCFGCRMQYSRIWANRLMLEAKTSLNCWFVTLTYDDEHIPISEYVDKETGSIEKCFTLNKRDLVLFNKRLRKEFGEGIRFYAAGEYGGKTFRPHYHIIYFNLPFADLRYPRSDFSCVDPVSRKHIFIPGRNEPVRSKKGFHVYVSDRLYQLWPQGFHTVQPVNWKTCAYVARYCMKKQKGASASIYEEMNIEPEFSLMSRRPGIGKVWYDDHGEKAYETDIIRLSLPDGPISFQPPGYYDDLFELDHADFLEEIKENRRLASVNNTKLKLAHTSKSYLEMLADEEYAAKHRASSLTRL